jgi:F-type H+-transporting ATPase subunit b
MPIRRLLGACVLAVGAFMLLAGPAAAQEEQGVESVVEELHHLEEAGDLDSDVAECAILALENDDADRCQESPNLILPATNELIWGAASFFVLLFVLWKFGLPAATKMSNERTKKISDSLDEAEKAKVDATSVLAEYQAQLADARAESSRIIEEARLQAEQVRSDLMGKAEAEVAELRQRNAEQVAAERGRVMGELQGQVAALAIELAEKVVESNLDREANTRLIENYISTVGAR